MSQFLHDFYGGQNSSLKAMIGDFEPLVNHSGVDIRFASEVASQTRLMAGKLGLDPKDTTAKELYFALLAQAKTDDTRFLAKLGLNEKSKESKSAAGVAGFVNKLSAKRRVFVPKRSVLKKLLQERPPKAALKLLHYRSFDSMYKRCPMTVILAAAELAQSQKWQADFRVSLAKLNFSDFEERSIEILSIPSKRWETVQKKLVTRSGHAVFTVKPAGGILIVPSKLSTRPGQTLMFTLAALRGVAHLERLSSLTKRALIDMSLGASYDQVLYAEEAPGNIKLRSINVSWHHQHRLIGESQDVLAIFEPHLSSEHFNSQSALEMLSKKIGGLELWLKSNHLGLAEDNQVVSCNLFDVLVNLVYERAYGRNSARVMQKALHDELLHRYLKQDLIRQALKDKLSPVISTDIPLMLNYPEEVGDI